MSNPSLTSQRLTADSRFGLALSEYDEQHRVELLTGGNRFVRNVKNGDDLSFSRTVKRTMQRAIWQFIVGGVLLILLAALGTLQYRWLGEVSNAERDRLRASLRARASELASDFDREITRTYAAFHVENATYERDPVGTLSDALVRARTGGSALIKNVLVVDARAGSPDRLQQLDPLTRRLVDVPWPPALAKWRDAARAVPPAAGAMLPALFMADSIEPDVPALIVPLPVFKQLPAARQMPMLPDSLGPTHAVIVWLDRDRVMRELLPALVNRHFGAAETSEYFVSVVERDHPSTVVYASSGRDDVRPENADVVAGLFALRLDQLSLFSIHVPPPPQAAPPSRVATENERVAITIVRRANGREGARVLLGGGDPDGAWQLLIRCKTGSLEALVGASRRRNLAIGLGVLGLLAMSFVFVIASAQRTHNLARQQIEFVAAVSHELRTPLTVIQSAGENLADGVVGDGEQVRRYGTLIRTEGRRLTDMVERVLEFAGIHNGVLPRPAANVNITEVVDDAIDLVDRDADERAIQIERSGARTVPPVRGDAVALRSCIQNVIDNAIKYCRPESTVEIDLSADERTVRIIVRDRGIGIDPSDLPHVFKPFFRGRRAVDAQIRGTGVGLSVVQHAIRTHGGDVRIDSRPGAGTTVTMMLPIAAASGAIVAEARTAT
jgi:signal transduction histidine kinase